LQDAVAKGLKANDWVSQVSGLLNGKGGGKELSAQATGTNPAGLDEAIKISLAFSQLKLGGGDNC